MLNIANSEPPTFVFFLTNVTSRIHYLGFSSNKRPGQITKSWEQKGDSVIPSKFPLMSQAERLLWDKEESETLHGLRTDSESQHFPHGASVSSQTLVITICHKTKSFQRIKRQDKEAGAVSTDLPTDGTLSHLIPPLSRHCIWPWDTTLYRSLPAKGPGEGPRRWKPETAGFWGSCQSSIWHSTQYTGETV